MCNLGTERVKMKTNIVPSFEKIKDELISTKNKTIEMMKQSGCQHCLKSFLLVVMCPEHAG